IINTSIGVAGGAIISIFIQGRTAGEVLWFVLNGYRSSTGIEDLDMILRGGGISPMVEVLLIVIGAVALSSLLEGTNIINPIIEGVVDRARSKASLFIRTSAFSSLLTVVTCDQTAGIILLGKLLQKKYKELDIERVKLARTISDTGTTIAPLIPWNVNSIIILAITGVATVQYAPFAVLCYLAPIITIISGYLKEKSVY
ncbi:MAG: Na+/H+ antiporter NhaC family protein, partial [Caulobacteraceae bacterium]